ncbi:MAG TPA: PIG-L family deacetylase, partial [Steroidobacteraceae bacterium]|nr:PIG-L family deacetylase [Steroidobacteraceae bacterium]
MPRVDSNPVGDEKRNPSGAAAVRALFALLMLLPPAIVAGASQVSVRQPAAELFEPSAAELPLPQDAGLEALRTELRRMQTTGRLLHTTAHPDDEDGGMLTLESRGRGVTAELLTLTRGEGGQNRLGSNLFDELGVLRTLELLASDRYYAVQQRFTRAVDFGFSKTAQETLEKWSGPQPVLPPQQPQLQRLLGAPVLADVVRVIRTFRPDVIVSRFEGDARDGHGHHQAAAILTRQAFRAAADPNAFPEQIAAGLAPWQAKKLYVDNVGKAEGYTLALDPAVTDPALGMSYQ